MSINKLLNQLKNDHLISATISYKGKNYIFRQPLKKINKKRLITLFLILIILTFIFLLDLMQLKEIKTSKMSLININRVNLNLYVIENRYDALKKLLNENKYVTSTDEYGWSPLHWSVILKNYNITKLLIEKGARKDMKSTKKWFIYPKGTTPRDIAVLSNNKKILRLF